jgi:polyphosphate kinase 2 (PPK2 family)
MEAYEDCLNATSNHHGSWYAFPANDKLNNDEVVERNHLYAW